MWRPYNCLGYRLSLGEHPGYPEVSKPYGHIFHQKNILRFEISMNNLTIMNMFESQGDLGEPIQDLVL
jgi:hypothetical protein